MSDTQLFHINPSRRCGVLVELAGPTFCCLPSDRVREVPGVWGGMPVCAAHAAASDAPFNPAAPYRRVEVVLHLYLAAVCHDRSRAHTEAVALIRRAVEAVGATPSLIDCRSTVGIPAPPGVPVRPPSGWEGG